MITIKPTSMIYKFHDEAIVAERNRTPSNLCPYMRRFLRLFVMSFIMFFIALSMVQDMILFPIVAFSGVNPDLLGGYGGFSFITGGLLWIFAMIIMVIFGISLVFNKKYASRRAIDRVAKKVYIAAADKVDCNMFYQWYKATHDKICPQLELPEKEEPEYNGYDY